jgi:phosphoglycerol transferase MdoB-like AlkP superfamily enzyme
MTKDRRGLFLNFFVLFLGFSLLTRLTLLVLAWPNLDPGFWVHAWTTVKLLLAGAFYDCVAFSYGAAPLALYLIFLPERIYSHVWHRPVMYALFFATAVVLAFNLVAEYYFFYEFGVRYNFIAVDYLVYTKEVIGNITESYNLPVVLPAVVVAGGAALWLFGRKLAFCFADRLSFRRRLAWGLPVALLPVLFYFTVDSRFAQISDNNYSNEVAMNGFYSLWAAFFDNELSYNRFYKTIDDAQSLRAVRADLAQPGVRFADDGLDIAREVSARRPLRKLNVILVVGESLSAEELDVFGAKHGKGDLPNLNALRDKSLFFNRFYASGTRTVRGLEAITLSMPPLPGESIIKRPDNGNFFSWGSVMRGLGYETRFVYGGFGYFDNMNAFFSGNGYDVVDRADFAKDEITFANIWGVCDGDLFRKTVQVADRDYKSGKPFFYTIMTTSNHRPFTYPEGKIDISPKTKSRTGALKYSDYAIGQLLAEARTKPWFKDTVFIFTADHCANSAGRTDIPVFRYHIPLIVYSPGNIKPQLVDTLTAQMDMGPTVLGLLGVGYESRFFGRDMLDGKPEGRAFLSTYEKLGFLKDGKVAVLGPQKYMKTYQWDEAAQTQTPAPQDKALEDEAVSFYQGANYIYKNRLDRVK